MQSKKITRTPRGKRGKGENKNEIMNKRKENEGGMEE
jgi:hypothetical protein